MKNITSSARFVIVTFFAVLVLSLVAFADKGPCVYTTQPSQNGDGATCNDGFCGGVVIFDPGCMDCEGTNESNCEPGAEGTITMRIYGPGRCRTASTCGINFTAKPGTTPSGCPGSCDE